MTARRREIVQPETFFMALMGVVAAVVLALGALGLLFRGNSSWPWLFLGSAMLIVTSGFLLAVDMGAWGRIGGVER